VVPIAQALKLTLFAPLLLTALFASIASPASSADGDFEFYVLSLSWSPTYCATDDDPDMNQCGKPRGFIAHGLWPQYESGYPQNCASRQPRWLEQSVIAANRDIFPSRGLAIHQWRKHGMCTGLPQAEYFDLIRQALDRVKIPQALRPRDSGASADPDVIEDLFVETNAGLSHAGLSVQCNRDQLTEVRICLTRDLEFRSCREVDADRCRDRRIAIPAP
jgi:ribonuclease T2